MTSMWAGLCEESGSGVLLLNPHYRPGFTTSAPAPLALGLHRTLPDYRPTSLQPLPDTARRLGLREVWLKNEAGRLGLPAYKVLGAVWATWRVLERRLGLGEWTSLDDLRMKLTGRPRFTLVTATDGNHGRGVARTARWLGCEAEVYVPAGTVASRIEAIRSEGARVIEIDGTYDAAVAAADGVRGEHVLQIQDHGFPGYEEIPQWVAEGYETIFVEADRQLAEAGVPAPDCVVVQIGVGTLASAVVRHYRREGLNHRPVIIGVEPTGAACLLRSIAAGAPVMLEATAQSSIMAGLNCGTPSSAAWPDLRDGINAFVAVEDELARQAMRELAAAEIVAGESGAAGLAGLNHLLNSHGETARQRLGLGPASRVLLFSTEGATDPVAYREIVG
jgi:diaminopropionate ammonia-lyase